MSIDVLIQGRLRGATLVKASSKGNPFASFRLAASNKAGEGVLCSCITFSRTAIDAVQSLTDGDNIAVLGESAISQWNGHYGQQRRGLEVTVHVDMTAYHSGRKRKRKSAATEPDARGGI
jgi:single-stranded DNA-binding protein